MNIFKKNIYNLHILDFIYILIRIQNIINLNIIINNH